MALGLLIIAISTGSLIASSAHSTIKLFASRAASMGAFTVLFIYTPEVRRALISHQPGELCHVAPQYCNPGCQVYPTKVRSFALGLNNSMSRLGAILAPFVAVDLGQSGHIQVAEGLITAICILAAILAFSLPYETAGQSLQVAIYRACVGAHSAWLSKDG